MRSNRYFFILFLVMIAAACDSDNASSDGPGTGQGGSMTRFAISGNTMYVVDHTSIKVFDIANNNFSEMNQVEVGWGIETVFAKGEFLYLGANDAMYIYSIINPSSPDFIFRYAHIASCDPVVVQGNKAYVTMRGGSACNRGTNALEIIDISDPFNPTLIENYPMESPHGLAVDGDILFLCEGSNGLKVFNIENDREIELITEVDDFFAYDVIARQGVATITGEGGIFQYTYNADGSGVEQLSSIPVQREAL